MREIEFRIKDCKGKWHYGYPVFFDDGSFEFFVNERLKELLPYEECSVECALNNTLGQYTGLCDKNGTKIFEGDIVQFEDGAIAYIEYEDSAFIFANSPVCPCYLGESREEGLEVIGNVFDTDELLEE